MRWKERDKKLHRSRINEKENGKLLKNMMETISYRKETIDISSQKTKLQEKVK